MKNWNFNKIAAVVMILLATVALSVSADQYGQDASGASIKILSPADKAQVDAGEQYHFHVWVDDDRGPGIHDSKGTYMLPKLSPGTHVITIKVVDKGHVPTGPQKSITVIAK